MPFKSKQQMKYLFEDEPKRLAKKFPIERQSKKQLKNLPKKATEEKVTFQYKRLLKKPKVEETERASYGNCSRAS